MDLTLNVRGPSYLGLTRSISWLLMPWPWGNEYVSQGAELEFVQAMVDATTAPKTYLIQCLPVAHLAKGKHLSKCFLFPGNGFHLRLQSNNGFRMVLHFTCGMPMYPDQLQAISIKAELHIINLFCDVPTHKMAVMHYMRIPHHAWI